MHLWVCADFLGVLTGAKRGDMVNQNLRTTT